MKVKNKMTFGLLLMAVMIIIFISNVMSRCQTKHEIFEKDTLLINKVDGRMSGVTKAYKSDWTKLKNGKELNLNKASEIKWNDVPEMIDIKMKDKIMSYDAGVKSDNSYIIIKGSENSKDIMINNNGKIEHKNINNTSIQWKKIEDKGNYLNNLIYINNYTKVIIENLNIRVWDGSIKPNGTIIDSIPELSGSCSIKLDNCTDVTIRNCYLSGLIKRFHVKLVNCEKILIDRVEIEGIKTKDKDYFLCGGGISVIKNDFEFEKELKKDLVCVIQNSFIHNNNIRLKYNENWDGITTSQTSNTLIFNCYFEDWGSNKLNVLGKGGSDCALDLSEPGNSVRYKDYMIRIEHNIFQNCKGVKNSYAYINEVACSDIVKIDTIVKGEKKKISKLINVNNYDCASHFFSNNFYYNTILWDYHTGYNVYHVNETFIFDENSDKKYIYKFEGNKMSPVIFENNIISIQNKVKRFRIFNVRNFDTDKGEVEDFKSISMNNNIFIMDNEPKIWVDYINNKENNLKSLDQFKAFIMKGKPNIQNEVIIKDNPNQIFKSFIFDKQNFYKSDLSISKDNKTISDKLLNNKVVKN